RRLAHLLHGRHQERYQDRNDGNHHEQFNQRKSLANLLHREWSFSCFCLDSTGLLMIIVLMSSTKWNPNDGPWRKVAPGWLRLQGENCSRPGYVSVIGREVELLGRC